MSESTEFEQATPRLRPELLAHCYRMMGSAVDAEDQVQETYLRAWRAYGDFDHRASVRTWMYRIATNTCLNALSSVGRRVLPRGLGGEPGDPRAPLRERDEPWLEPLPEAMLWGSASLAEHTTWQMPPSDRWYAGDYDSAVLSHTWCPAKARGDLRFLRARANGQPALGMYLRKGRQYEAFQFQVLHVTDGLVDDVVGWFEPHLFRLAGLPLVLDSV